MHRLALQDWAVVGREARKDPQVVLESEEIRRGGGCRLGCNDHPKYCRNPSDSGIMNLATNMSPSLCRGCHSSGGAL